MKGAIMKKLFAIMSIFLLVAVGLLAQSAAGGGKKGTTTYTVTFQLNPPNAQLFVDGQAIKGNVATLTAGNHTVKATAPGYLEYNGTINVTGNITVPITLQPATATVTFQLNVPGAQIYVNNQPIKGTVATLPFGTHTVRVSFAGFIDFTTTINVTGNMVVPVTMQQATAQVSFQVNPPNAQVYVDNQAIKGNTATVTMGNHSIRVTAPGYLDYNTTVTVNGDMTLPVTLQAQTFKLSVNANNVKGAQVLLNGAQAGTTPFHTQLTAGTYTVTIQAPGYIAYTESFTVGPDKTIAVNLQQALATLTIQLPAANINTDMKGGHWSQIIIWVDGVQQKGNVIQLTPGKHLIKITSGGMQVEIMYEFEAGKSYVFEPFMGLNIK
ncbi:MAG TPA: PEGA domain-containing protein [Spirochaetales bacterium]|nr:PEGA domain-containing protein [Spirochaetales bacterium]